MLTLTGSLYVFPFILPLSFYLYYNQNNKHKNLLFKKSQQFYLVLIFCRFYIFSCNLSIILNIYLSLYPRFQSIRFYIVLLLHHLQWFLPPHTCYPSCFIKIIFITSCSFLLHLIYFSPCYILRLTIIFMTFIYLSYYLNMSLFWH